MRYDVVIIGGGTSAAFAAFRFKEAGVSSVMVSNTKPSASMGCGELFSTYAGKARNLPEKFEKRLFEVFKTYRPASDSYINVNGSLVSASHVPSSTIGMSEVLDKDLVLVSLPGIHDLPIETSVLEILKSRTENIKLVQVRLQSSIEDFYLSPVQWASKIDHPEFQKKILQRFSFQLQGIDAGVFIFPPILGIAAHEEFLSSLTSEIEAPACELLGVPGWPPGLRMGSMIEESIAASGIEIIKERVVSVERKSGGDIENISTSNGTRIFGRFFVLATGGACGGGIILDRSFMEPVFHLPVFVEGKKVSELSSSASLPAESFWSHNLMENDAVMSLGIRIDEEGRPLNEYGRPVSYNLRACGSIVGSDNGRSQIPVEPGKSALMGWNVAEKILNAI